VGCRRPDGAGRYTLPSHLLHRIAERVPLSEDALGELARPLPVS
jgi:hypothetical protein